MSLELKRERLCSWSDDTEVNSSEVPSGEQAEKRNDVPARGDVESVVHLPGDSG